LASEIGAVVTRRRSFSAFFVLAAFLSWTPLSLAAPPLIHPRGWVKLPAREVIGDHGLHTIHFGVRPNFTHRHVPKREGDAQHLSFIVPHGTWEYQTVKGIFDQALNARLAHGGTVASMITGFERLRTVAAEEKLYTGDGAATSMHRDGPVVTFVMGGLHLGDIQGGGTDFFGEGGHEATVHVNGEELLIFHGNKLHRGQPTYGRGMIAKLIVMMEPY
jgi:hypothetical protein